MDQTVQSSLPVAKLAESKVTGTLVVLSLGMLLSSLGTSIANVGLPTLAKAFEVSFQAVQWVVLAYLLSITTLIVSAGRLADMVGRRRLLLAGLGTFVIASIACGLAPRLWVLIAARAVQGAGAALMMSLTMAFIADVVPRERVGRAMGLLGTMSAIGTALGPSLGGALTAAIGWRAIFLINLPLGILAMLLAYRHLPADRQVSPALPASFDWRGTIVLALSLASYALGMTVGGGAFGWINVGLLCLAALGGAFFVLLEGRTQAPLVQPALFKVRATSAGFVTSLLVTTVAMTTLVVGPFYLTAGLGFDVARVGLVMSVGPIVAALLGVPAGRGIDRFGAARMVVLGLVAMMIGCIAMAFVSAAYGAWGYVLPLAAITAGFAMFQAGNNTVVMTAVDSAQRGVASGLLNLSRNLGLITGASLMGALYAYGSGTTDATHALAEASSNGLRLSFAVATALVVIALVVSLRANRPARRAA